MEFDVPLSYDDAFDDGFDDLAAFLGGQRRPAGVEVAGFGQDFVAEEELDLLEVELASPLLGYDLDPNGRRLLVNEPEAVQVRAIFDLYLETESLLDTAHEPNRRGRTARRWVTR